MDILKIFKKIDELPGGDKNPFETPVGPTKECLTSNQVVEFVKNNETNSSIINHLNQCRECRERIARFKKAVR